MILGARGNNGGGIDGGDLSEVAARFGTAGQPIEKAGLLYDSAWINITDKCGQNITITHNLNIIDGNDPNMIVDITGKTTPDGGLLRFLGLTGQQGWNRTYGGTSRDRAYSVVQTVDGGYALAGHTMSFGAGYYDAWLVKIDANGNMLWNKTYGGTSSDTASSLVRTVDGGYALAGYTLSFGAGGDFWLVKTDANGNMLWNKTHEGTSRDRAYSHARATEILVVLSLVWLGRIRLRTLLRFTGARQTRGGALYASKSGK